MNIDTSIIRSGFDGKKCLVHARFCEAPGFLLATAQNLDVMGADLFEGILAAKSFDGGKSWTEFTVQSGLCEVKQGDYSVVPCDATPLLHKKTGRVILIGRTSTYDENGVIPEESNRSTFYSVYDEKCGEFSGIGFVEMSEEYKDCGNGCGQFVELENGDLLIPVYYSKEGEKSPLKLNSAVMRCSFDGEKLKFLEMGNTLTSPVGRGLYEPSLAYHGGAYYMTMRNDESGYIAKSLDGLHYDEVHIWAWEDGNLLQNYNTQQHFMTVGDDLYLVYTRRGADNDHVFRHRAPLFASKVNDRMQLVRDSEIVVVPERGTRLGNFCAYSMSDGRGAVMAAEWMQPKECVKYGSDNSVFLTFVTD